MRDLVTLRVTSPCEHGHAHEFLELPEGVMFSTRACCTTKGVPRWHTVRADRYPQTVTRK